MTPGFTSNSRASSLIRIFFIEELQINLANHAFNAAHSVPFIVADLAVSAVSSVSD
jgi:hypothetical protein